MTSVVVLPGPCRYLYTRQIDITLATAPCIHRLATDLGLKRLQADSGRLFAWLLPMDKSFQAQLSLYKYAMETGDPALQDTCLQYLAWNLQELVRSPAWGNFSRNALQALLARDDLVVPDEGFVLRGLESWVRAQHNPPASEDVASLLEAVRFPMIPAEQLYDLRLTSDLYVSHWSLFLNGTLEGFQFNALPPAKLKVYMEGRREQHTPRIYTGQPWSVSLNFTGAYARQRHLRSYFQTPVHYSAILQVDPKVSWFADVCLTKQDCSNLGLRVDSAPSTRLSSNSDLSRYRGSIRYSNKVVLSCDGEYVFQVLHLKKDIAWVANNVSAYPCYTDQLFYQFVVSPECVF